MICKFWKIFQNNFSWIIIYLSFLNCDWLLIWEVQWFHWTQKLLVPVEKFTVRMPKGRLELATPGLQNQCSSHWAIQLKSYCWEGVQFSQLVYCIIIYLSFLNCDWLLIRDVQWFHWTQKLLVPVERFTVRMPKGRLELATTGLQTQCSSHWAILAGFVKIRSFWIFLGFNSIVLYLFIHSGKILSSSNFKGFFWIVLAGFIYRDKIGSFWIFHSGKTGWFPILKNSSK